VRALLIARKQLQAKMRDIELSLRGLLRDFGLKVGEISKGQFATPVRTLTAGHAMLKIAEAMLRAREALQKEFAWMLRAMLAIARDNQVCRQLMSVPSVGALIAVTFTSAVDNPERFARLRAVGAHFGLTPKKYHSGETHITGAVSRVGERAAPALALGRRRQTAQPLSLKHRASPHRPRQCRIS
jgi:transposase